MDRHGICAKHGLVDPEDIYTYPSGRTKCRLCGREYMHKMRARKRWQERRPRVYKRRKDANLTRRQVYAAYEIYKAGISVTELGRRGWKRWGHANERKAAQSLYLAFEREGFHQLNGKRFGAGSLCAGCGCSSDQRTFACSSCRNRHWQRKRRNAKAASPERKAA